MVPATAVDTSVVIAGLLTWHDRHPEASVALESALDACSIVIPAPVLVEDTPS